MKSSKKPTVAQLERAYQKARAAEIRAIEAMPETPPRHTPTPAARAAADRAWAAAARTNEARMALGAALEEGRE